MPPKDAQITEKSSISFGIVLTIAIAGIGILGGGAGWVWWASNVSARLSSIESYMASQNSKVALIDQLDSRVKILETFGSAPTKASMDQLAKEVNDLRRSMELQAARSAATGSGGKP